MALKSYKSLLIGLVFLFTPLEFSMVSHTVGATEIVKCRSRTGQVIYSDVPCEKQGASTIGTVDATPNEVGAIRRTQPQPAQATTSYEIKAPETPARQKSGIPPRNMEALRIRERELNNFIGSLASTPELKSTAQEELTSIRSSGVCKLSDDQRKRRDGAYNDLGSLVRERRLAARGVIRQILSTCERM